ncbi:hypothetical protein KP509_04G008400 [Ceratopteris richardii]|uniref:Uncharacterized protein n=1 Tax=Ceratopteris richardii TaxID=49495 RepID=A0A8T2UX21_CERRI|nr:hypothetical protein KP509_04G008400 [Ceratopteris richardii]
MPLCAENNTILARMASSARQEASLVAIAQHLVHHHHQQHQHQHQHQGQQQKHAHAHAITVLPQYLPSETSTSSQHLVSMDHWTSPSVWQHAKSEDFANSLYSDSMCDLLQGAPSAMEMAHSSLMMPSLDSHIPESEFSMPSCAAVKTDADDSLLCTHSPHFGNTLSSAQEVGDIVDGLLSNTTSGGGTGQVTGTFGFETSSEWFDCLMYDTDDNNMASCLEPNPCESTQSSEPASTSIDCLPCTPFEEALPDAFELMEAARLCASDWAQESGHETNSAAASRRAMASCSPLPACQTLGACLSPQVMTGICDQASSGALSVQLTSKDSAGMHAKRGRSAHESKKDMCRMSSSSTSSGEKVRGQHHRSSQVPSHGVQLMQLLLECAKAVDNNHQRADKVIPQLKAQATRYGDPIQRLASYFTEALCKRLARAQGSGEMECSRSECSAQELTLAYKAMNEACPYFTFAQLTANQAILEAIDGAERVHIVDFGISQGVQWAAMLQAIASQEGHRTPRKIVITGVASPELGDKKAESLATTGRRLSEFARQLNLSLEFRHAHVALDDPALSPELFTIDSDEVVVVNFMLELCNLLDGSTNTGVLRALNVAAKLSPRIATLAEMDAELSVGPFQKRFVNALYFFSAMFDSLEAGMNRDSMHRLCMERWLLGERIHSMVGGEDDGERRRLQTHAEWRRALEGAGFRSLPLSHYAVSQAHILLWRFCESFTLNEQQGSLALGWQNRPLLNVSAWTLN